MCCLCMFLQIAFKVLPRTGPIYVKRTCNFPINTSSLVYGYVFHGERGKAAFLPVGARVLQFSGDVFQSHIPDSQNLGSACWTKLVSLSAPATDVVSVCTHLYGWHDILPAHRTLQFLQQFSVDIHI